MCPYYLCTDQWLLLLLKFFIDCYFPLSAIGLFSERGHVVPWTLSSKKLLAEHLIATRVWAVVLSWLFVFHTVDQTTDKTPINKSLKKSYSCLINFIHIAKKSTMRLLVAEIDIFFPCLSFTGFNKTWFFCVFLSKSRHPFVVNVNCATSCLLVCQLLQKRGSMKCEI